MRKPLTLKIVLLNFIVYAFILGARENQNAAEKVLERAYTSIAGIEAGKIFLRPDKLYLKQGMIFIEDLNGDGIRIPVVFSADGLLPYMQVDDSIIFNSWKCECGAWNHKWDNPMHCRACGRTR